MPINFNSIYWIPILLLLDEILHLWILLMFIIICIIWSIKNFVNSSLEIQIGVGDYNWACFASQQAAKRALKALAMHVLGEYVRGHDLIKLYRRLKQFINQKIDEDLLAKLSAYYTLARYPNAGIERPHEEFTEGQAKEALQIAEVIVDEVSKAIRDP